MDNRVCKVLECSSMRKDKRKWLVVMVMMYEDVGVGRCM